MQSAEVFVETMHNLIKALDWQLWRVALYRKGFVVVETDEDEY